MQSSTCRVSHWYNICFIELAHFFIPSFWLYFIIIEMDILFLSVMALFYMKWTWKNLWHDACTRHPLVTCVEWCPVFCYLIIHVVVTLVYIFLRRKHRLKRGSPSRGLRNAITWNLVAMYPRVLHQLNGLLDGLSKYVPTRNDLACTHLVHCTFPFMWLLLNGLVRSPKSPYSGNRI